MPKIKIEGDHVLSGTINVSGAKNSAVALIPAAILSDESVTINNLPNISDIDALNEILTYLNAKVEYNDNQIIIDSSAIQNCEIPENISKKLRASYYFMGALLGKFKEVTMYFPGGCSIGKRPINLHLKGFEMLGAKVICEGNKYTIKADKLVGNNIYLDFASVGATINIMLAAVKAVGTTTIENAAKEPEIVNVATFLNNMGAKITGAGTGEIKIKGVDILTGCFHEVIPDRIEAGTYLIAGALMGHNLTINNIIPEHLESLLSKLKEMNIPLTITNNSITVTRQDKMKAVNIKTQVYPGFPTDLQQPLTVLLVKAAGKSIIEETIWENRFGNTAYLNKMGANISITNNRILIAGPSTLKGTEVCATDLRAGACLVLAGLYAKGITTIDNIEYILRGYDNIVQKLTNVGAKITIE